MVADATHQTPYIHHWHLSIWPTVAPRLVPWCRKNRCQVSDTTRRWQHESCQCQFPFACQPAAYKESKEMEINGYPTVDWTFGWLQHYSWEVMDILPRIPNSCPVTSTSLGCLRSTCKASEPQQMPISSSDPSCWRQVTPLHCTLRYKPWCQGGTNA